MMYGAAAALAAFIMTALGMPALIKKLKSMQFGQTIYELGPKAHLNKQGTPNMGGILIATAAVVSALLFSFFQSQAWRLLPILLAALGSMAIGFRDDYIKNVRHNHEGLKPMQKVAGQVVVGLLFSVWGVLHSLDDRSLYLYDKQRQPAGWSGRYFVFGIPDWRGSFRPDRFPAESRVQRPGCFNGNLRAGGGLRRFSYLQPLSGQNHDG